MKKYMFMIIIIILLSTLLLIVRNRLVYYKGDLNRRKHHLDHWYSQVMRFIGENKRIPEDLYEVTKDNFKDFAFPYIERRKNVDLVKSMDISQYKQDPNYFKQEVEYELIRYSKGWFIIELNTTQSYPYQLIIDDKGHIYSDHSIPYYLPVRKEEGK